jgi:long-chain acyl-CoA synthetase
MVTAGSRDSGGPDRPRPWVTSPTVNLASIIDGHPDDRLALLSRGHPTTYGELRARVGALRGALVDLGVEPGDRVAIIAANNLKFVIGYLASLGVGAVAVPLNPASPSLELQRELAAIGAKAAIVGPNGAAAFSGIERAAVPSLEHVISRSVTGPDVHHFDELLEHEPAPVVERGPDDLAVLIFTAGTAGSPKAAMLTHGNLLANLEQVQQLEGRRVGPDDVGLGVLPMFHIFGLNVVLGLNLMAGASVVLAERFDPVSSLDTIRDRGVTVVAGAPPMWMAWANLPGAPADAFASVRLAVSGASRLTPEVAEAFERRFGLQVSEGYGLTEAAPVVTSSAGEYRPGSIGQPLPGVQIRLVDPVENADALLGDTGEIWVKGPNVFPGYWRDEAATNGALTPDGWLRTGDLAVADDDGWLYIVDRAKDIIIVSGFNVFPAEVEEVLLEHPGIADAGVVGVDHPYSGEAVKAYVVAAPGVELEEDEVIEFCASRFARYKCPTKVMFVDEIPQGLGGKVLRRELRE